MYVMLRFVNHIVAPHNMTINLVACFLSAATVMNVQAVVDTPARRHEVLSDRAY